MELFLFHHSEWERLYNCSRINLNDLPLEKRLRYKPEAIITIVLCAIYYILYIPCIFSIWRQQRTSICYLLLFYIAIHDIGLLWVIGFLHGFLALEGAVFCTRPVLTAIGGNFINYFWYTESAADIFLAINRCMDLLWPNFANRIFTRKKMYIYMALISFYGLFWLYFSKWPLFNAAYFGWLYDPFAGFLADKNNQYEVTILHAYHNFMVAGLTPLIYLLFFVGIYLNNRKYQLTDENRVQVNRVQLNIFLQIFIISMLNTLGASFYVYIQHVYANEMLIVAAQFMWLHVHGFPPVIYLALNKTIRKDTLQLARALFGKKHNAVGNNQMGTPFLMGILNSQNPRTERHGNCASKESDNNAFRIN